MSEQEEMSDEMFERLYGLACEFLTQGRGVAEPRIMVELKHARVRRAQQAEELRQKDAEIQRLQREVHAGNVALDTANETVTRLRAELAERDGAVDEALRREDALRADLARLQPSGKAAEDVEVIMMAIKAADTLWAPDASTKKERDALARLATGAQAVQVLADALEETAPMVSASLGPCWCGHVWHIPPRDDLHGKACINRRAALRLAGRLP